MNSITAPGTGTEPQTITGLPPVEVRKICIFAEEILHEGGPRPDRPRRRGAIAAVIRNPYAGRYVEIIEPFMEALKPLGLDLSRRLVDALGGDPKRIEAYGKGSIVGLAGELEHGAFWHVPGGYGMREVLGGAKAIVPSAKKVGTLGTRIDIPIHHIDAAYVRSHFDAMEVGIPDAPRPDELVLILAMTDGPRIHARMGGLKASEISKGDGLR
ncbi:MAG: amino acid synthesis family protein [Burkholderiales bacterium]|nr:amino acid synthesis family protein [Burkholderiales bacterium]